MKLQSLMTTRLLHNQPSIGLITRSLMVIQSRSKWPWSELPRLGDSGVEEDEEEEVIGEAEVGEGSGVEEEVETEAGVAVGEIEEVEDSPTSQVDPEIGSVRMPDAETPILHEEANVTNAKCPDPKVWVAEEMMTGVDSEIAGEVDSGIEEGVEIGGVDSEIEGEVGLVGAGEGTGIGEIGVVTEGVGVASVEAEVEVGR